MEKKDHLIDILSDLIYRDFLGLLDEQGQEKLRTLCDRYPIHKQERDYILRRLEMPECFVAEKGYRRLGTYIRRRKWFRWSVAAVVFLLLGLGGSYYAYIRPAIPAYVPVAGNIAPGSSKATITLANGEKIDLEKLNRQWKETDGTLIQATGGELVYEESGEEERLLYNTIDIPRGGEYRLVLADGTRVWLNAGSQLRYPVRFVGDKREIFLKGEAYFDVSHSEYKPFLVSTSRGVVQVLGTCFNVRDYADEHRVVTTLETGQVRYITAGESVIDLLPGYALEDRLGGALLPQKVNTTLYTAWKDGKFIFEDASVETIMSTLGRWYDVDVEYENEEVKHLHFTGDLERYATINTILNFMEAGGDVRFKINGNTICVYKK